MKLLWVEVLSCHLSGGIEEYFVSFVAYYIICCIVKIF